jgi:hypothetical protein
MTEDRVEKRISPPSPERETRGLAQDTLQFVGQVVESGVAGAAGGYVAGKVAAAASNSDDAPPPPKKEG